jgi:Fe-S-cluster containining protein
MVQETVRALLQEAQQTPRQVLAVARSAFLWSEQAIRLLEASQPLPQPIVCEPGCHFCCYNQVEMTPPEALLIADYIRRHWEVEERQALLARLAQNLRHKQGKNKAEIARMQPRLACPLLIHGLCAAYPVRPMVCRAMHSLDRRACETAFANPRLLAMPHYDHRHTLSRSVAQGVLRGCQAAHCQAGTLDIDVALSDVLHHPSPAETWVMGGIVFPSLAGAKRVSH